MFMARASLETLHTLPRLPHGAHVLESNGKSSYVATVTVSKLVIWFMLKDVATAMVTAADHSMGFTLGFVMYNVATGDSVSNNQILATLGEEYFP